MSQPRTHRPPARRAVVTGGAGFVGSHLCERFLAEGTRSSASTTSSPARRTTSRTSSSDPGSGSSGTTSPAALTSTAPVDDVLHFASPASPSTTSVPIQTLKVGSLGTHTRSGWPRPRRPVPAGQHLRGVRRPAVHPQTETYWGNVNPVGPRSVYDEAKRFAEAHDHGLPPLARRQHRTSSASSTPTARGCGSTTAGRSRTSSARRCAASRSPSTATAARPGRSATSTTSSTASRRAAQRHHRPVNIGNPAEITMLEFA